MRHDPRFTIEQQAELRGDQDNLAEQDRSVSENAQPRVSEGEHWLDASADGVAAAALIVKDEQVFLHSGPSSIGSSSGT